MGGGGPDPIKAMKTLAFTPEELELSRELLQHTHNEMDMEVVRTDNRIFKEQLKHRRAVLDQILDKLAPAAPVL